MKTEKTAVSQRILVALLSLGLLLPHPAAAATAVMRATPAPRVAPLSGAAGVTSITLKMPTAGVADGGLKVSAPTLSAPIAPSIQSPVSAPSAVAAPVAVEAHPVIGLINSLQAKGINLPASVATRQDAQQLLEAADAMPAGAARDNLVNLAKAALNTSGPSASGMSQVFDNSLEADEAAAAATPKATGFWGVVSKIPGLKRFAAARAAKPAAPVALKKVYVVPSSQAHWAPSPKSLPASTKEVPLSDKQIVGQDKAVNAIRFGAMMTGAHYNVFVSGPDGAGRATAVRHVMDELAPKMANPGDLVAATNFDQPESPVMLEMGAGQGETFKEAVGQFVAGVQQILPKMLASGDVAKIKKQMHGEYEAKAQERKDELSAWASTIKAGRFGVAVEIQETEEGAQILVAPTLDGKPVTQEELDAKIKAGEVTQAEWEAAQKEVAAQSEEISAKAQAVLQANQKDHAMAHQKMAMIEGKVAAQVISQVGQGLAEAAAPAVDSKKLEALQETLGKKQAAIDAEAKAVRDGAFGIQVMLIPAGNGVKIAVVPTYEGEALDPQKLKALIEGGAFTKEQFTQVQGRLNTAAQPIIGKYKALLEEQGRAMAALEAAKPAPTPAQRKVEAYVNALVSHAAENYQEFLPQEGAEPEGVKSLSGKVRPSDYFRVSVLADNGGAKGAPVVYEDNPTYENLFGSAESNARTLAMQGVGLIKAGGVGGPTLKSGSFLKARGGFLVLDAMKVLQSPGAWQALAAAVSSGKAEMVEGGLMGLASMKGDKYYAPAPVKVILIGAPTLRMMLQQHSPEFAANFGAVAEFEPTLAINDQSISGYLYFLKKAVAVSAGEILDLTQDAISSVLELSARMVDSNQKLTAQFGVLYGLLREATFWAKQKGHEMVTGEDINTALAARDERENVYLRRMGEVYRNDIFSMEVGRHKKAGQIKGLAVMGSTGVPMRITIAKAASASFNLHSADQEAHTTGKSYDKSFAVTRYFLKNTLGKLGKLAGDLQVSFEQNYGGIDGDSATSTMMYATLSALSGVGIKQHYAVTGSADQFGTVQAIGGVNEKIEGFYDLVSYKGLLNAEDPPTIIIPMTNVGDLQLRADIAEAMREDPATGKKASFRVIGVQNVAQGIEQLTDVPYSEILKKASAGMAQLGAR